MIGIDFGTTNTVIACANDDEQVTILRLDHSDDGAEVFRSVLFLEEGLPGYPPRASGGPAAIRDYLGADGTGRLIQSMKSFLGQASFTDTQVFGHRYTLEDLLGLFLRFAARAADAAGRPVAGSVIVGRPVLFAGYQPDERLAVQRLRTSLAKAGFGDVVFVFEPVAAAYAFIRRLKSTGTVLVADFGGGTTDFSVVRVSPATHGRGGLTALVLATGGVGVAGDVFDRRIIRNVVSGHLGRNHLISKNAHGGQMPMPSWLYQHVEEWHHLSLLNTPRTLRLLDELAWSATDPSPVERLRHFICANLGFSLSQSVARAKATLSADQEVRLVFRHDPIDIDATITRNAFETWIANDLGEIRAALDETLAKASVTYSGIDQVFMTGGTSLVPAVRAIFSDRFGEDRLMSGDELVSVASGLALIARERAQGNPIPEA